MYSEFPGPQLRRLRPSVETAMYDASWASGQTTHSRTETDISAQLHVGNKRHQGVASSLQRQGSDACLILAPPIPNVLLRNGTSSGFITQLVTGVRRLGPILTFSGLHQIPISKENAGQARWRAQPRCDVVCLVVIFLKGPTCWEPDSSQPALRFLFLRLGQAVQGFPLWASLPHLLPASWRSQEECFVNN